MVEASRTPIWLDVTRLVSRAGRGVLTGIDRVEVAWLRHLVSLEHESDRYLFRSSRGYLLLGPVAARRLLALTEGRQRLPDRADLLSRLSGKGRDARHRAEAALRPHAVDRALPGGLPRLIRRAASGPLVYLNTGHANLSAATLGAFGAAPDVRVAVLIHDLIPVTHPDLVAEGMPTRFETLLQRVRASADLILCNSEATAEDLALHWNDGRPTPRACVTRLGVDVPPRIEGPRDPNHFVMLGTIEPRKNHALMIDVWERLATELPADRMPHLHIIGPTGWKVGALMDRIERHPLRGRAIHLHGPLAEPDVEAHLSRAVALLFPSLAEGFGYPPIEAALRGALPICSDLPVFRKNLGDSAVYLKVTEAYSWSETIKKHVLGMNVLPVPAPVRATTWAEHHESVFRALAGTYWKDHPCGR